MPEPVELRQAQVILQGDQADEDDEQHRDDEIGVSLDVQLLHAEVKRSAHQAGAGVYLFPKQYGDFVGEDIADHAAHHRRKHAHDGRNLRAYPQAQGFFGAHNGKQRNAQRVEKQESATQPDKELIKQSGAHNGRDDSIQQRDVLHPHQRVTAQHDVAEAAPANRRDKAREPGTEPILLAVFLAHGQRPRHGKHHGAQYLKYVLYAHCLLISGKIGEARYKPKLIAA